MDPITVAIGIGIIVAVAAAVPVMIRNWPFYRLFIDQERLKERIDWFESQDKIRKENHDNLSKYIKDHKENLELFLSAVSDTDKKATLYQRCQFSSSSEKNIIENYLSCLEEFKKNKDPKAISKYAPYRSKEEKRIIETFLKEAAKENIELKRVNESWQQLQKKQETPIKYQNVKHAYWFFPFDLTLPYKTSPFRLKLPFKRHPDAKWIFGGSYSLKQMGAMIASRRKFMGIRISAFSKYLLWKPLVRSLGALKQWWKGDKAKDNEAEQTESTINKITGSLPSIGNTGSADSLHKNLVRLDRKTQSEFFDPKEGYDQGLKLKDEDLERDETEQSEKTVKYFDGNTEMREAFQDGHRRHRDWIRLKLLNAQDITPIKEQPDHKSFIDVFRQTQRHLAAMMKNQKEMYFSGDTPDATKMTRHYYKEVEGGKFKLATKHAANYMKQQLHLKSKMMRLAEYRSLGNSEDLLYQEKILSLQTQKSLSLSVEYFTEHFKAHPPSEMEIDAQIKMAMDTQQGLSEFFKLKKEREYYILKLMNAPVNKQAVTLESRLYNTPKESFEKFSILLKEFNKNPIFYNENGEIIPANDRRIETPFPSIENKNNPKLLNEEQYQFVRRYLLKKEKGKEVFLNSLQESERKVILDNNIGMDTIINNIDSGMKTYFNKIHPTELLIREQIASCRQSELGTIPTTIYLQQLQHCQLLSLQITLSEKNAQLEQQIKKLKSESGKTESSTVKLLSERQKTIESQLKKVTTAISTISLTKVSSPQAASEKKEKSETFILSPYQTEILISQKHSRFELPDMVKKHGTTNSLTTLIETETESRQQRMRERVLSQFKANIKPKPTLNPTEAHGKISTAWMKYKSRKSLLKKEELPPTSSSITPKDKF